MRLRPLALGLAMAILGALFMLVVTYYPAMSEAVLGEMKGESMRTLMLDIYPFYDIQTWYGVVLGVVFGFLDGLVFGLLLGWLYNLCLCGEKK